ncbi:HlyB/MsbA family ABC transporter [Lentinus tigrinus ALCF2SS1-6]|uniref:HlyB/MsbA family ABC transporter n=1 Tax=Lentinus tigrinus ALCF2SS1-6 TaxID=1328759 RepID=A0A5C2RSZ2_9APHY|nr:HlyB/MsbA family ABC transporter [Lentinus tigrinus ALCF2SS1-6]
MIPIAPQYEVVPAHWGSGRVYDSRKRVEQRYPQAGRVVKHRQYGVWDWYEERNPDGEHFAVLETLRAAYSQCIECAPYVARTVKDVMSIPGCALQLGLYSATELGLGLTPALSLWYQGQLLDMMEVALETGTVDSQRLLYVCAGRIGCTIVSMVLRNVRRSAQRRLNRRIGRWFATQSFRVWARLDVPTFSSTQVQNQLISGGVSAGHTTIWQMLQSLTEIASRCAQLGAQTFVLLNALKGHQGGAFLTLVTLASEILPYVSQFRMFSMSAAFAWASTSRNKAYLKVQGWKTAVSSTLHRKEFVAGNMEDHAISEFISASEEVGDDDRHWTEIQRDKMGSSLMGYLNELGTHLPQIAFTVAALKKPKNMPESLASLNLVQAATRGFASSVFEMYARTQRVGAQLTALRDLYEMGNIPNIVPDGTVPFPVDPSDKTGSGVSVEFRDVTFKYPDAKKYALRGVSFTLSPGQLCVIVGSNGAGKSTILKLIVRLYDPEEGQILVGGHDIRTLKLKDLRRAMSVLFQDYTHFPLSVRDNIALGDLSGCGDDEHVRLAARLSGAEPFINTLPDGLDTYFKRPMVDQWGGPPDGFKTRLGNPFDSCLVREAAGIRTSTTFELSGGQMQRLAVARTFMRSVVRDDSDLGLLLFDEPSASLDPAAEHDLFDRLRELKGSKTMIFSTHRFGNLTRYADLILYMNESGIVESGTHEDLIRGEGEYARLWKLQAQAFI